MIYPKILAEFVMEDGVLVLNLGHRLLILMRKNGMSLMVLK